MSTGSHAWCFCNSSREHIAEFTADMRLLRFRPAHALDRQQFKAFVLYRWGWQGGAAPSPDPALKKSEDL